MNIIPTPRTDFFAKEIRGVAWIGFAQQLERELADARREISAIKAMLLDPIEVELDMIRGNIAIPQRRELGHIFPENEKSPDAGATE